ncbi:uncharacterized protein LTR77_007925 [Saxophila tyrrhenica]|uniref:LysM domain-containing protein n=1 Tax=Saxophila tyrrhenica TaxID=1690608 RepID=A0AAV9P3I0_9PEZI|nr:hypothetical protein LTR77_007925 [Saxophila tyrrhenica]
MSSNNSNNASALTTSSTLRPRAKRLISGLSEGDESAPDSFDSPPRRIASPSPSPFESRSASPIPAPYPQRTSSSRIRDDGGERYAGYSSWGRRAQVNAGSGGQRRAESPNSFAGIWGSSWTTLQGLASDFLGNELTGTGNSSLKAKKKPVGSKLRTASDSSGNTAWGPTSASNPQAAIGSGTRESREAALRAQKRKDMLTRQESSYAADALGKFKRRLSDEQESRSAPPAENDDRAALVYVHHVKKDDTLAGITIKYNCSANVIRKANRMWPNDTVQSRQTIVLPVDACGVKGKPVAAPDAPSTDDLLGTDETDDMAAEEISTPRPTVNGDITADMATRDRTSSLSTASPRTSVSITSSSFQQGAAPTTNASTAEAPYTHDSWVLLSNSPHPTEIARLSRRALGYFPPARRKSISLSDLDTPSTSLDLARTSTSTNNPVPSPSNAPAPARPGHRRRLSNATNGYFPSYLAGPGGVGSMSANVHSPGPAQDGLNKFFAKHLPDVSKPKNQRELYQPDVPMYRDDDGPGGSGTATPSLLPKDIGGGAGLNLENVGGAIEGWVRRMAVKARTPSEPGAGNGGPGTGGSRGRGSRSQGLGPRTSVGAPGKGRNGVGDLIEMTDEFELGGDDESEEEGRGRSEVGSNASGSGTQYFGGAVATARGVSGSVGRKSGKGD